MPVNKKNIVLMFPGQGSQYLHMGGNFLSANKKYIHYFDTASIAAGKNIIDIIEDNNGMGELLNNTRYSQIAIYTLSCALNDYLLNEKIINADKICIAAGHSLGDYSALYACGAFNFKEGAQLVCFRSRAMAETAEKSGRNMAMAAVIGLYPADIEEVLKSFKGKVYMANINDCLQTVISGYAEDIIKASEALKKEGAKKVITLKVNIASHCPLMKQPSEMLENYLTENFKKFNDLKIKFFSSTEVREIKAGQLRDTLTGQLLNPVRWKDSIEKIVSGFTCNSGNGNFEKLVFIEIGPQKVLSGLVKRILSDKNPEDFEIFNTDSIEEIERINS
jgi:[acyl-carrier-protein] S-malonyltransferase